MCATCSKDTPVPHERESVQEHSAIKQGALTNCIYTQRIQCIVISSLCTGYTAHVRWRVRVYLRQQSPLHAQAPLASQAEGKASKTIELFNGEGHSQRLPFEFHRTANATTQRFPPLDMLSCETRSSIPQKCACRPQCHEIRTKPNRLVCSAHNSASPNCVASVYVCNCAHNVQRIDNRLRLSRSNRTQGSVAMCGARSLHRNKRLLFITTRQNCSK